MQRTTSQPVSRLSTIALFALGAACSPAAAPAPEPAPVPATTSATRPPAGKPVTGVVLNVVALADELTDRTNAARRAAGLPGLSRSVNLMQAAQLQADQMVKAGRLAHELPDQPYPTLKARLTAVQYEPRAAGENIADGPHNATEALAIWMDSTRHRANILSKDYTELGTGVAAARNGRLYFVQVFARPAGAAATRVSRPG